MKKYIQKPIEVNVIQLTEENADEIFYNARKVSFYNGKWHINGSSLTADMNDYLIIDGKAMKFVSASAFDKLYEAEEDDRTCF